MPCPQLCRKFITVAECKSFNNPNPLRASKKASLPSRWLRISIGVAVYKGRSLSSIAATRFLCSLDVFQTATILSVARSERPIASARLHGGDFLHPFCRDAFEAMYELCCDGKKIDPLTVLAVMGDTPENRDGLYSLAHFVEVGGGSP